MSRCSFKTFLCNGAFILFPALTMDDTFTTMLQGKGIHPYNHFDCDAMLIYRERLRGVALAESSFILKTNRIFLRFTRSTSCLRHPRQNKSLNHIEKKIKRIQCSISSYFTGPQQRIQRKNITEDETRSDIADRMVDSSISLAEESSQAEGSLANPSLPETMVSALSRVVSLNGERVKCVIRDCFHSLPD